MLLLSASEEDDEARGCVEGRAEDKERLAAVAAAVAAAAAKAETTGFDCSCWCSSFTTATGSAPGASAPPAIAAAIQGCSSAPLALSLRLGSTIKREEIRCLASSLTPDQTSSSNLSYSPRLISPKSSASFSAQKGW